MAGAWHKFEQSTTFKGDVTLAKVKRLSHQSGNIFGIGCPWTSCRVNRNSHLETHQKITTGNKGSCSFFHLDDAVWDGSVLGSPSKPKATWNQGCNIGLGTPYGLHAFQGLMD